MDDVRFDALTRAFSQRIDRRSTLRALLGIGGAVVAGVVTSGETDAARRGYAGPQLPTVNEPQLCASGANTCRGGTTCNGGAGLCMPGLDTPNLSYCVISMSQQYGSCGSCQTHEDCLRLTGDQRSPCLKYDENCKDCGDLGGACGVLQP